MIDNKRIEIMANFGSYKPRFVIKRLLGVAISAVALLHLAVLFTDASFTSTGNQF
ncbi:MAG: hypothetical protein PF444_02510 [Bacteroidales bacterium]|nr:hypothetical protein [Bacteroidales bacterium]